MKFIFLCFKKHWFDGMQKRQKDTKSNRLNYIFLLTIICIILISSYSVFSKEISNIDTDFDGLNDVYEKLLGSNINDSSDVKTISILNSTYLLVDTDNDNISDIFYDTSLNRYNTIKNLDGVLYIDSNFDNEWDYNYYKNNLSPIEKSSFEYLWILVIAGIIIFVIVIILILFKTGILYFYEEEYIIEE